MFDADFRPVGIQLFGDQHGQAGPDTLAHFRMAEQHSDAVVIADAQERIRREHLALVVRPWANRWAPGMTNATTSPPPTAAAPLRKPRRDNAIRLSMATSTQLGGAFHRGADAWIGATAANVAGQRLIDVAISRLRDLRQQRRRRHDLPGLTVTALHHIEFGPGLLHRVRTVGGQAFDGENFLPIGHGRGGRDARAQRRAVDVHRCRRRTGPCHNRIWSRSGAQRRAGPRAAACPRGHPVPGPCH